MTTMTKKGNILHRLLVRLHRRINDESASRWIFNNVFPTFWSSLPSYDLMSPCIMQVEFLAVRGARKPVCRINSWLRENLLVGSLSREKRSQLHSPCVARYEMSLSYEKRARFGATRRICERNFRFS